MFVWKHAEAIAYFNKYAIFFKKKKKSRVNNSTVTWIKNAKFPQHYF